MNSNYFINFICRFFWICCVHNTSPGRNDNFISSFPILSSIYFVYLFIFVCCIFTQLRELRFSLVSRCLETRLRSVCGWSVLRGDSPSEGPAGCRLWGWSPGPLSSSTPGLVILYLLLSSPMPQADGFNCFDCLLVLSLRVVWVTSPAVAAVELRSKDLSSLPSEPHGPVPSCD